MLEPSEEREKIPQVMSIESITSVLQPEINVTEVVDERKIFQVHNDLPTYNASEIIEVFWNGVFKLQSADGDSRYNLLPVVIKSALVLAQTNAESERSLSVNARMVTKDRASLGEKKTLLVFMFWRKLSDSMILYTAE